jgi:hypothetical protein
MSSEVRLPLLYLFQLSRNHKILFLGVVLDTEEIRLAAYLTVLHIGLDATGGLVHHRLVPLAATGTLKSRFHYGSFSIFRCWLPRKNPGTPIMAVPDSPDFPIGLEDP